MEPVFNHPLFSTYHENQQKKRRTIKSLEKLYKDHKL